MVVLGRAAVSYERGSPVRVDLGVSEVFEGGQRTQGLELRVWGVGCRV